MMDSLGVIIRPAVLDDFDKVETLAKELPHWFTQSGLQSIRKDFHFQKTLLVEREGKAFGFICYYSNQGDGYIGWMGVSPIVHRQGIGRVLVSGMIQDFKSKEIANVHVSTLGGMRWIMRHMPEPALFPEPWDFQTSNAFSIPIIPNARRVDIKNGDMKAGWNSAPFLAEDSAWRRNDGRGML